MGKIFVTGDKHGNFESLYDYRNIESFCGAYKTTLDDVMIVLGDHGVHYDEGGHDALARYNLGKLPITFIMIRGNHDMKPCKNWKHEKVECETFSGMFWRDPDFSNILYTDEYGWYKFGDKDVFVIGGAYSADKYYRLDMQKLGHRGFRWFEDEQLTAEEREDAFNKLIEHEGPFAIMSHTCPQRYTPVEMFISLVDQSTVDKTMEIWLDDVLCAIWREHKDLTAWYCGHWHTDKNDDIMTFMYRDIKEV